MKIFRHTLILCLAAANGGCLTEYPNPATRYVQRIDTVTLGAGDAQAVNTAVQMVDPWPPYAANARIPGNGPRMVGAVERYEGAKGQGPGAAATSGAMPAPLTGAPPLYPLAPITPAGSPQ
jgi:hypothetical protein